MFNTKVNYKNYNMNTCETVYFSFSQESELELQSLLTKTCQ